MFDAEETELEDVLTGEREVLDAEHVSNIVGGVVPTRLPLHKLLSALHRRRPDSLSSLPSLDTTAINKAADLDERRKNRELKGSEIRPVSFFLEWNNPAAAMWAGADSGAH